VELSAECILFALLLCAAVWVLGFLGQHFFNLRNDDARRELGFVHGVSVTTIQYPLEFAARRLAPSGAFHAAALKREFMLWLLRPSQPPFLTQPARWFKSVPRNKNSFL